MPKFNFSKRDSFGSKIGVIAAATGAAIGLGNIWRFPYVTGENGGAAFLIVYLAFIVILGLPIILSEFVIGRRAQRNAFGSFKKLKPNQPWYLVGLIGITSAFFILAFYSTIAGWTLEYFYLSVVDGFSGKDQADLNTMFSDFQSQGLWPVIWQIVFMFLTAWIIYRGVRKGIEKYAKILMPMLLIIIIIISIRSLTLPGATEGLKFLFYPDFSKITPSALLEALGHSFFTLSIGMGSLITYGSYINKKSNLPYIASSVIAADTIIAIIAGIAIFPAVFAFGINPAEGEALVFITLPGIFQQMHGGYFWSILFFLLLIIAALTSTVSILEVVVAFFSEELNINRQQATVLATLVITILGVFCTLSQGPLNVSLVGGENLFSIIEWVSVNLLLPLGALLIVIFVGWFMGRKNIKDEISNSGTLKTSFFGLFIVIIKVLAPVAIALIFLYQLGIMR